MNRKSLLRLCSLLAVIFIEIHLLPLAAAQDRLDVSTGKISALGKYAGYSQATYDGWIRTSQYVRMRDGTQLAVDIFRPTHAGALGTDNLPVVWTHHRYQRAIAEAGQMFTILDSMPWLEEVLRHGYVVAAVDMRGSGASFGTFEGMYAEAETADAYDITEWLAAQPWSGGAIGMYGVSYLASTQYMAASRKPPHLKAIFPEKGVADQYALLYSGGIYRGPFVEAWTKIVHSLDVENPAFAVDADVDVQSLLAAIGVHKANRDAAMLYATVPYRDSVDPVSGATPWRDWTPITHLQQIRESNVAIYHLAGWHDRYVRDQLVLFRNLGKNQKITIGPWSHVQRQGLDQAAEHLRWWDYWLKGIDNEVTLEAPVHYYVMGAPAEIAWRSSATWPPPESTMETFYFGAGRSGTSESANDGALLPQSPSREEGSDAFIVDLSAAVIPNPRWSLEADYPELTAMDAKGLTYTTAPLSNALEITGHPIVHVWVSSSLAEAVVFVYLEEVDEAGHSRYVSEGALRASNRATSDPGYDFLGMPYHRGNRDDRKPLTPGEPVQLDFDLFPTSTLIAAGHRIRVSISGADKVNARTSEDTSRLVVYRGGAKSSRIDLPIDR
jgi:putative CocE/NonD family hydrolase